MIIFYLIIGMRVGAHILKIISSFSSASTIRILDYVLAIRTQLHRLEKFLVVPVRGTQDMVLILGKLDKVVERGTRVGLGTFLESRLGTQDTS